MSKHSRISMDHMQKNVRFLIIAVPCFAFCSSCIGFASKSFAKHFHRGVLEEIVSKIANTVVFLLTNTFNFTTQHNTAHLCHNSPFHINIIAIHSMKILFTPKNSFVICCLYNSPQFFLFLWHLLSFSTKNGAFIRFKTFPLRSLQFS